MMWPVARRLMTRM
jgi:glutathione S-transferase